MIRLTKTQLTQLGKMVGFDAIGATSADAFPELEPRLAAYEERGDTGFESRNRLQRTTPRAWMPEAVSLISVALSYLTPSGKSTAKQHPSGRAHGHTSVYAYGADYHEVMKVRLEQLRVEIEHLVGHPIQARYAVDTAPLVDRRVAERAGIGWVGKNCMFFTPEHGSFVFLGTLAVDIEVETADAELSDECAGCSRCLTACPTGALIAPGVIDARTCLSYITQMKGIIPIEFREKMGRRVWGCDTCQWACPVNKRVVPSPNDEFSPSDQLAFPELIEILDWSNRSFAKRYGATAAAWRGVHVWKRNALIALGNSKDDSAVDYIIPFLKHPRPELRASAAWALYKIGGLRGKSATLEALADEQDADVAAEMTWAVGEAKQ